MWRNEQNGVHFSGQDSFGALSLPLAELNEKNASPLLLKAKAFLKHDLFFDKADQIFSDWKVLEKPSY